MNTKAILFTVIMLFCSKLATSQVWNGNLVFTNQAEIDDFSFFGYTAVNGNLEITDAADNQHDITNLAGLAGLTSVSGNLVLKNNNLLPNTAFLNLTSVGSLRISENGALTTINGLPITNVPNALLIESNNALTSITAFSSVTTIGKLSIRNNPLLSNINGFASLIKVSDSLTVAFNNNLTHLSAFSRLNEVEMLVIQNNPLLANVNGLTALVKVKYLDISYNTVLTNLNGLTNLISAYLVIIYQNPALVDIAGIDNVIISDFGSLYIHNNNVLENIVGPAGCVRLSFLSIEQNAGLTGISGFNALKVVYGLDIAENQALANVSGFAQLDSVNGTLRFQQNGNLTTINAFSNLKYIGVNYTNINNYVLSNIAPMPLLDSISGFFQLLSDTMLTQLDFVPNLRSIGEGMSIRSCKRLTNINGLSHLTTVHDDFFVAIDSCLKLTSLAGLAGLTKIPASLSLRRLGITSLNGLQNIRKLGSTLFLDNNLQLTSLNELINLDTVLGTIRIISHPLITNLNGLRNLRRAQNIVIGLNASLVEYCGLYPVLAGNNPPFLLIDLNLVNPTAQDILNAGPCTPVQLPVTLKLFAVRCNGNKVIANWVTTHEFNSSHFVLQRSIDGVAWTALGSIQAAGNSGVEQKYNFIDNVPAPNGLYRLAQYDIDASVRYSAVVKGGCAAQDEFIVWPNPVTDKLTVSIQSSIASVGRFRIFDSKGVVMRSGTVTLVRGINKFEVGMVDLAAGVYIVQVWNADGVSQNAIVVKKS
jgi:hypothetical protein